MRPRAPLFAVLVSMVSVCPLAAQERLADLLSDPAVRLSRPVDRARVVVRLQEAETKRRQNARDRAILRGLPLRTVSANGRIQEIADFNGDRPVYLTTQNVNAAISTGANLLQTSPYSLTGAGVTIGLWDGGSGRATHQEFGGRITVMDGSTSIDHATHVGGTLIASGADPAARGMASSASIKSYDWNSDTVEMAAMGATTAGDPDKIYLSNHSYGYVSGWNYVGNATRAWEWYGAGTSSAAIEDDFGRYNDLARDSDSLAFNAPYYLIFRSAGNDRIDNPAPGQNVSLSPGGAAVAYSYAMHPSGDGNYRGGFETIGYNALAKNVITVGSATDAVTGGLRDPAVAFVNSFSSWGPTDDGRIKPDIVANGDSVYSSLNGSDASYGIYNGTSMATPNAAGSAALLVQQFGTLFPGQAMRSSTLKGLLVHTADDLGNAGPDYKFGWGLVNVQSAADLIRDHSEFPVKQRITESELTSTITTRTHSFVWDGVSPISATLCWTDPAGSSTTTSDSRSARLVNNLNLKITAPNGSEALPFVMPFVGAWTQASMDSPATTGINNTDNVEQARIAAPPVAGVYQATVSFSGSLTNNSQNYSLLLSGASATPPPLVVSSVTPDSALSTTVTVDLTGTGLRADTAVKLARYGQSDIFASGVQMIGEKLRCQIDLTGAAVGVWDVVAANPDSETFTLTGGFVVVSTLWSESFDGSVSGWTSQATTGSNSWTLVTTPGQLTAKSYFAPGPSTKTTTRLTSPTIPVSASASKLQLRIWHSYNLQSTRDAGKLELSTNNGSTWFDVESTGSGASFASNGYNSTISTSGTNSTRNEFSGQRAWSGNSNGPVETVVNLTDTAKFAGKNLRVRWRIATNGSTSSPGWYLDSVVLFGNTVVPNQPPAITSAATSTSVESVSDGGTTYQIIRSASTNLAVAASDDGGEPALTYAWTLVGAPPHPVFFSTNATNAAKTTNAIFDGPGDYQIAVTARDAEGLTTDSTVRLRVLQTATGLVVSPATATLPVGSTQQFSSTLLDQFGLAMASQPTSFTWEASGGGTINPAGLFTAVSTGGHLITARDGGISNTAGVTVIPGVASIVLGNLDQTFDGTPKPVSTTTNPPGLSVAITYDNSSTVPTNANSYAVVATIADPNYQGYVSDTLIIEKAAASIDLTNLAQTYDGTPKSVTATTTPANLTVSLTYNGASIPPTDAGTYTVIATVDAPNHQGTATQSLVIGKATATIDLTNLAQTYDGTPKSVAATTTPENLAVSLTYNGASTPPTDAGIYTVVATVDAPNHQVTTTQALVIEKAAAAIELTNLAQTYDGTPKPVTATTTPENLAVSLTYNGASTPPTDAGTYTVSATVDAPNHQGAATQLLVIEKATAAINLTNLTQTYDGTPKPVTATTTPENLTVSLTYSGSFTPPTDAGDYTVVATVDSPNHQGSITQTLVIEKATATLALADLVQTYDGTPKSVTATTTPENLPVSLTYNGSSTPPTDAGTYTVVATVAASNHQGSVTQSLIIEKATASIDLTNLAQIYDGTPKSVNATTTPANLTVSLTCNGASTPPTDAGTYTVVATVDAPNHQGTTTQSLVIEKANAAIALTGLTQTYDGTPKSVTATTTPANLTVSLTYSGTSTPPTDAGAYTVVATVDDPNHQGTTTQSLVIEKATAAIALTGLTQTYDGTPKPVTATTTPENLSVSLTYDGSSSPPTDAGSYMVVATVDAPNHQGITTQSLVIEKANATIELTDLVQTYDGSPKSITATTTPENLTVSLTYNGASTPPTDAGTYTVVATVDAPNHQGSITQSLVIEKAPTSIALTGLALTYDGTPKPVTATTTPENLAVTITYDGTPTPPIQAGTYLVTAVVNDINRQGSASDTLVIAPGNDFTSWKNIHFSETEQTNGLADDLADPDGDNHPNLTEYALGTHPRQFTPQPVPVRDLDGLSFTFTRPANLPGISYEVESSEDLGVWRPVLLELVTPGTTETLRARDPLDTGNPAQRYLRLRISRQ